MENRYAGPAIAVALALLAARADAYAAPPDRLAREEGPARPNCPLASRLLSGSGAGPLAPGSGYIALHGLFVPFIAVGVTDLLAVGGGASLVPGLDRRHLIVSPRVTPVFSEELAFAAGITYAAETGRGGTGIVYAEATSGGSGGSATFGIGWGFAGGRGIGKRPVLLAGFLLSVADGIGIVSENWFPPGGDPALVSLGLRRSIGRFSADVAVWLPAWLDSRGAVSYLPWVSLAWEF